VPTPRPRHDVATDHVAVDLGNQQRALGVVGLHLREALPCVRDADGRDQRRQIVDVAVVPLGLGEHARQRLGVVGQAIRAHGDARRELMLGHGEQPLSPRSASAAKL